MDITFLRALSTTSNSPSCCSWLAGPNRKKLRWGPGSRLKGPPLRANSKVKPGATHKTVKDIKLAYGSVNVFTIGEDPSVLDFENTTIGTAMQVLQQNLETFQGKGETGPFVSISSTLLLQPVPKVQLPGVRQP